MGKRIAIALQQVYTTVGQHNYCTTSVTLLYQLPLLAVLFIKGNNNVIFHTLPQSQDALNKPLLMPEMII